MLSADQREPPRYRLSLRLGAALLVLFLAALPIREWFLRPGPVLSGELFSPQYPFRLLRPLLHSWNETTDLGFSNVGLPAPPGIFWPYTSSYLLAPVAAWSLVQALLGRFAVGAVVMLCFALPFGTMYWAAKKTFSNQPVAPVGFYFASALYALSPWTTQRLFAGPFMLNALAYSFIPLIWGAWLESVRSAREKEPEGWRRNVAGLGLALFALTVALPHLLLLVGLLLGGDLLLALARNWSREGNWLQKNGAYLRTATATLALLGPMLAFALLPGLLFEDPARPPNYASLASLEYNQSLSSLGRALSLWGGGDIRGWQPFGLAPPAWAGWPLSLGALAGALLWHRRIGTVLLLAAVVGVVAAQGTKGPLGHLVRFAFVELPGFGIFRDTGKFLAIVAFSFALLNGYLAGWVARLPGHRGLKGRGTSALLVLPLLASVALNNPLWWDGSFGGVFVAHVWPPEYRMADLKLQALSLGPARVLALPTMRPGTEYSWYTSQRDTGLPSLLLTELPLSLPLASDVGALYSPSSVLASHLSELLQEDPEAAESLAREMGVGAIFIDPTLKPESPGGGQAAALRRALAEASWLRDVSEPELPRGTLYRSLSPSSLVAKANGAELVAGSRATLEMALHSEQAEAGVPRLSWRDFERIRNSPLSERISLLFLDADRTDALGEALRGRFAIDLTRAVRWNYDSTRAWVTYQGHPNVPGLRTIPLNLAGLVMTSAPETLRTSVALPAPGRYRLLVRALFGAAAMGELQIALGAQAAAPLALQRDGPAALRWVDMGDFSIDPTPALLTITNGRLGVALLDELLLLPAEVAQTTETQIDQLLTERPLRAIYTQAELAVRSPVSEASRSSPPRSLHEYQIKLPSLLWDQTGAIRHTDGTLQSVAVVSDGATVRLDPSGLMADGKAYLILERGDPSPLDRAERGIPVTRRSASTLVLPPQDEGAGLVLVSQSYSPSWRLDGQPPLHANDYMMAFWVERSGAEAVIRHGPESLYRWLLALSAAMFIICAWLAFAPSSWQIGKWRQNRLVAMLGHRRRTP